ncbi:hypothetical protein EV363DRAFT_1586146 [Boletus edulis]|nr:hypothetical protein EV363DRAFT_1586146 [Boletus edulis]
MPWIFNTAGNALYIFIIANSNVTGVPDANFVLDQVTVDRYTHTPSSSTDYQYNVPVYVNESMTRRVQSDESNVDKPQPSVTVTDSDPSPTSLTSLRPTIGAIVGGVVGEVSAVVLVATSRGYKKNNGGRPQWNRLFYLGSPQPSPRQRVNQVYPIVTPQPSIPPTSSTASSSPDPPSSGNNAALREQVEMLKDGVARLRDLHDSDRHALTFQSETPPESS